MPLLYVFALVFVCLFSFSTYVSASDAPDFRGLTLLTKLEDINKEPAVLDGFLPGVKRSHWSKQPIGYEDRRRLPLPCDHYAKGSSAHQDCINNDLPFYSFGCQKPPYGNPHIELCEISEYAHNEREYPQRFEGKLPLKNFTYEIVDGKLAKISYLGMRRVPQAPKKAQLVEEINRYHRSLYEKLSAKFSGYLHSGVGF